VLLLSAYPTLKHSKQIIPIGWRAERCNFCESTPWLSIDETLPVFGNRTTIQSAQAPTSAVDRLHEVRHWPHWARYGLSFFLNKLKTLITGLHWLSGNVAGDFSVYIRDSRENLGCGISGTCRKHAAESHSMNLMM